VGDEFFAVYGRMNGGAGGGEWMLRLGSLDTHTRWEGPTNMEAGAGSAFLFRSLE
jgi:hypothetical protein